MTLTIGEWVLIAILAIICIGCIAYIIYEKNTPKAIISGIICICIGVVIVVIIFVCNWYHKNTASSLRSYKDFTSEMENDIDREIIITAEDGKRYLIYYGIQDTLPIIEK